MPYGSFTTYWHWMGEQSNFIYFRPRQSEKYAAWIMKERRKKRLKKRHDEVVQVLGKQTSSLYLLHPMLFSSILIKNKFYLVQAKAAKMDRLDQILLDGSLVRLELWLIFSDDIGLPHIFNSVSCRYKFTFSSPQVLSLECSVDRKCWQFILLCRL